MKFEGLHAELTELIVGVFYLVSNELGYGFFESVYRRSMAIALREAGMTVREEVPMPVYFHGQQVGVFLADLVVNDAVVLELKVADSITSGAEMQLKHYLRSSSLEVGMVLAFGERANHRRVMFTNDRKPGQRRHGPEV